MINPELLCDKCKKEVDAAWNEGRPITSMCRNCLEITNLAEIMTELPPTDNRKKQTILISGRYDRPHLGHIVMMQRAAEAYKKVVVVVLKYKEQSWPAEYRAQILREALENSKGEYEVIINEVHFAKVGVEDIIKFPDFDYWGGGNMAVMKHMESMKINTVWLDRPYGYEASTDRLGNTIKELI